MTVRDKNGYTEEEFLEIYRTKNYPRPYVTADMVVLSRKGEEKFVLLVKRGGHPYLGQWALPGGFLNPDETIEECAARELTEETGVKDVTPVPVGMFSKPGRDPRGWVITQAYTAEVDMDRTKVAADDDAADARWFKIVRPEESADRDGSTAVLALTYGDEHLSVAPGRSDLAFDHGDILLKTMDIS